MDEISLLALTVCRKWSSFATRELRRSAVELSSLLCWQAMDMFTHLDKVHVTEKNVSLEYTVAVLVIFHLSILQSV